MIAEILTQGLSFDVLHDKVIEVERLVPVNIKHLGDVRMFESRHHACFAVKTRDHITAFKKAGFEDFECKNRIKVRVADFIDGSHPTLTELAQHLILVRDLAWPDPGLEASYNRIVVYWCTHYASSASRKNLSIPHASPILQYFLCLIHGKPLEVNLLEKVRFS